MKKMYLCIVTLQIPFSVIGTLEDKHRNMFMDQSGYSNKVTCIVYPIPL